MRIGAGASLLLTACLAACGGSSSPEPEGGACRDDLGCQGSLICYQGTCRNQDCQDMDCQAGWACIGGLCCNQNRCCGPEDPQHGDSCTNGLDDDCDGWTDGQDQACGPEPDCTTAADCDDGDVCTENLCQQGVCSNPHIQGECCFATGAFASHGRYPAADDAVFLNAADLDGDGVVDLVMGSDNEPGVAVLLGQGDGSLGAMQVFHVSGGPWATALEDFDGDGRRDVVVVDFTGKVWFLRNQSPGPGQLSLAAGVETAIGGNPLGVTAADLDQDGDLDLAVAQRDADQVRILLGDGLGGFQSLTGFATGQQPWWVAAADFDGDQRIDLATANSAAGSLSVLLADGPASFSAHLDYPVQIEPQYLLCLDLDGDWQADLVAANRGSGSVSSLLGRGDGTFATSFHHGSESGGQPRTMAAGDFDADGIPDLVVANSATDSVSLLLGNGDGTFQPSVEYPVVGSPSGVVAQDLDLDGVLDLAVACAGVNEIQVLLGQKACR